MPLINKALKQDGSKQPVINCHTHIFTSRHVPPFLARTFLIFPLYLFLHLRFIVWIFRSWLTGPARWKYKPLYKTIKRILSSIKSFLAKNFILKTISWAAGTFLTIHAFFIIYKWLSKIFSSDATRWIDWIEKLGKWFTNNKILWPLPDIFLQIAIVLLVLLFIPSGRNLILFVTNKLWNYMGKLPGKNTKELIQRYLTIGRHAFHKEQSDTFARLTKQYYPGTAFVALPMDMEYMKAGWLRKKNRYRQQMEELASIKGNHPDAIYPFIFADPRRIGDVTKEKNYQQGDKEYFNYTIESGANGKKSVLLTDCFINDYIGKDGFGFSGFKIYPALGYYPFDEKLLPLWKYAADNNLPVLTHCIRGTIFFRGWKKRNWYQHPVFEEFAGEDVFKKLLLPQRKNIDFSVNFTHPLNYLCLLEESLLRIIIGKSADSKLKNLFGYTNDTTELTSNLNNLKLCFGHFGGDDEWKRFLGKDRDNFSTKLFEYPDFGLDMLNDGNGNRSKTKTEQVWKGADWYTIICSLMLQYPNVYADISYILHDDALIVPLLKQTLQNPKLKERVLYGTDFYVVRNHKTDKEMLGDMMAGLDEDDFDQIARANPRDFLNLLVTQAPVAVIDNTK